VNLRALAACAITVPVLGVVGVAVAATGTGSLSTATTTIAANTMCLPAAPVDDPGDGSEDPGLPFDDLTVEQLGNARIIYTVAVGRALPPRAVVIAVTTALQESHLINLHSGDRDSLGLFQQRPSQGWGTPEQILDPVHASSSFYNHLVKVPNWQTIPIGDAAQAVQISAYPRAYDKWIPLATKIVAYIGGQLGTALPSCGIPCPPSGGQSSPPSSDTCAGGQAVLARAETWLTAWNGDPVPYLSSGSPGTWFNGYRRTAPLRPWLGRPAPGSHRRPRRPFYLHPKTALSSGDHHHPLRRAGHFVIFDH
jgi:hypothetical protein